MKKILSIDGGGIRGIIPGQVMVALERKIKEKTNDPEARIADYFDFVAGTSTGGILSCLYLAPDENNSTSARFSAQQAVDLYVKYGKDIFNVDTFQQWSSGYGIFDEKYNADALEKCLLEYFKDLKISQLLKPCIIAAYNIEERKTHFFAQHDHFKKGDGGDFFVRDVCRATSAAPTYFEVAEVKSMSGVKYPLVDGGVYANNPALCAYSEVRNADGAPTAKDMFIVSLGTGSQNKSYSYEKARNFGSFLWIRPVIDMMMSGAAENTHYHLTKMFSAQNNEDNYIRIQPSSIKRAHYDMDDASDENILNLVEAGTATAENCPDLDRISDILIEEKGRDSVQFQGRE